MLLQNQMKGETSTTSENRITNGTGLQYVLCEGAICICMVVVGYD